MLNIYSYSTDFLADSVLVQHLIYNVSWFLLATDVLNTPYKSLDRLYLQR